MEHSEEKELCLIHGVHVNPDGIEITHAWVILPAKGWDDPTVYDSAMTLDRVLEPFRDLVTVEGDKVFIPIGIYYFIHPKARIIKEYTGIEAITLMHSTGKAGPWDAESNRIWEESYKAILAKKPGTAFDRGS